MGTIEFTEIKDTKITSWENISTWIKAAVGKESYEIGAVSFVFMSDEELLVYNQKYLDHDFYTDVITFDDSDFPKISGDILISVDRIEDNCNKLKTSYKEEFLRVIIHGILHLCGYKDKDDNDIVIMREKEAYYLDLVKFEV